jgi:hypothetical protein
MKDIRYDASSRRLCRVRIIRILIIYLQVIIKKLNMVKQQIHTFARDNMILIYGQNEDKNMWNAQCHEHSRSVDAKARLHGFYLL